MNLYKYLNKTHNSLLFVFIINSVVISAAEICALASLKFESDILSFSDFSKTLYSAAPFALVFFFTLSNVGGKRSYKAFWACACVYFMYSLSQMEYISLVAVILFEAFFLFCFNNFETRFAVIITLTASLIFGILLSFVYDYAVDLIMNLSDFISGRGVVSSALFGFFTALFSAFDIRSFDEMFFFKSFGGAAVSDESVVTGAVNLYNISPNYESVSAYLSGHYYVIFLLAGVFLCLFSKLKQAQKLSLAFVGICVLLSGNTGFFMSFVLLESPWLFLSLCVLSSLCYGAAYALNLSVGYRLSGSVFELVGANEKSVYFFACGVVFIAVGFFTAKYFIEKYSVSDCYNIYYPSRLEKTVDALGGIKNILRYKDGCLEVRNPKLVNTLALDCEISDNIVKSNDESFEELEEYINL